MVKLRTKLHLSRQGRMPSWFSPTHASCLGPDKCNLATATATIPAPTTPAAQPAGPAAELPSSSPPGAGAGAGAGAGVSVGVVASVSVGASSRAPPRLTALPEELLLRVASFCDLGAILGLRRCCRALHRALDKSSLLEKMLPELVSRSASF